MVSGFRHGRLPDAIDIPFDNSSNGFISEDVQSAIEEVTFSASPGFSFGRNGLVVVGTWLRRPGNVPSNRAGVTIPFSGGAISNIACSNQNIDTYTLGIYEHDGDLVNLSLLTTVTVTSARGDNFVLNVPVTQNKQIAVRLESSTFSSVRDLGVDIIIRG
jgi:hypothetical protein